MNETQQSEPLSSFVCDLGAVDTSRPCPSNGSYVVTYTEFEVKPAKDNQGQNLFLTFQATGPVQSIPSDGTPSRTLNGYKWKECCLLWQHPNMETPWQVKLGIIANALLGTTDATRPAQIDWAAMRGKTCQIEVKAKNDPEYGMKSEIKKFGPPPSV